MANFAKSKVEIEVLVTFTLIFPVGERGESAEKLVGRRRGCLGTK